MTVLFSSLPCSKFEKNERRQIKNKTLIQLHNPQIITQRCSVFSHFDDTGRGDLSGRHCVILDLTTMTWVSTTGNL